MVVEKESQENPNNESEEKEIFIVAGIEYVTKYHKFKVTLASQYNGKSSVWIHPINVVKILRRFSLQAERVEYKKDKFAWNLSLLKE